MSTRSDRGLPATSAERFQKRAERLRTSKWAATKNLIVALLEKSPGMTLEQVSATIDRSGEYTLRMLDELRAEGRVTATRPRIVRFGRGRPPLEWRAA